MTQFLLQPHSTELLPFGHINELALQKNNTIPLKPQGSSAVTPLRLLYIIEGKFEWTINHQPHTLYPGDLAMVLPGQYLEAEKNVLNMGTVNWLHLQLQELNTSGTFTPGKWSGLTPNECSGIGRILRYNYIPVLSNIKDAGQLLNRLAYEIVNQEIGYITRVNHLLDELLILIARQLSRQNNLRRDFPQSFLLLEQSLRNNLAHQWTVEEMGALIGLGNTAFSEKVKSYTGFSPLNYLINIRITEALKLLKRPHVHVTDIALNVGFYSSQHFATTFKKLTGYTPREFRKKNLINKN